jgi:hypothetical protein
METLTIIPGWQYVALAGVVAGLVLFERGLLGGRGLLRPSAGALARTEGWRLTVLGLALAGLSLGLLLGARWLVFLSLGIGFVEVLEASMVIAAWRAGDRQATDRSAR